MFHLHHQGARPLFHIKELLPLPLVDIYQNICLRWIYDLEQGLFYLVCVCVCVWVWLKTGWMVMVAGRIFQTTNLLVAWNLTPLWIHSVETYLSSVLCPQKQTQRSGRSVNECEIKHHQPLPTLLIFNDSISKTIAAIIQRVWTLQLKRPCTISNGKFRLYLSWPAPALHVLLRRHDAKLSTPFTSCVMSPVKQQQPLTNYKQHLPI